MSAERSDTHADESADSGSSFGLLAMRFQLPYGDLDAFIKAYAVNVSAAGMFIAAEAPPAVGTTVRFEVVLGDQPPILRAEGEVVFCTTLADRRGEASSPARGEPLSGFSVRFTRLDAAGRSLLTKVLAYKAAHPEQFVTAVPRPYASLAPPAASPARASGGALRSPAAEEAALQALLRPAPIAPPPATDAARLLDELLGRRPG